MGHGESYDGQSWSRAPNAVHLRSTRICRLSREGLLRNVPLPNVSVYQLDRRQLRHWYVVSHAKVRPRQGRWSQGL